MMAMIEQLVAQVTFVQADALWVNGQAETVLTPFFASLVVALAKPEQQSWYDNYMAHTATVAALARQTGVNVPELAAFWENDFHVALLHDLQNHTAVDAQTLRTVLPLAAHVAYEALAAQARRTASSVQALAKATYDDAFKRIPDWLMPSVAAHIVDVPLMANDDIVLDLAHLDAYLPSAADSSPLHDEVKEEVVMDASVPSPFFEDVLPTQASDVSGVDVVAHDLSGSTKTTTINDGQGAVFMNSVTASTQGAARDFLTTDAIELDDVALDLSVFEVDALADVAATEGVQVVNDVEADHLRTAIADSNSESVGDVLAIPDNDLVWSESLFITPTPDHDVVTHQQQLEPNSITTDIMADWGADLALDVSVFDDVPAQDAVVADAPSDGAMAAAMSDDVDTDLAKILSTIEMHKVIDAEHAYDDVVSQSLVMPAADAAMTEGLIVADDDVMPQAKKTTADTLLSTPSAAGMAAAMAADDNSLVEQNVVDKSLAMSGYLPNASEQTAATQDNYQGGHQDALLAYRQAKAGRRYSTEGDNAAAADAETPILPRRANAKQHNQLLKVIVPLLVLGAAAAAGLWYYQSHQTAANSESVAPVAAPTMMQPQASQLSITVGQAGELYACQAQLGSNALAEQLQALLHKNFTNTVCVIDINDAATAQMAGFERLTSVIAILKSVPFASLELIGDTLYINAPNANEVTRLVQDLGALMGDSGVMVKPMPPLDKQARIDASLALANAAMDKLGAAPSDVALARALSLQIIDLSTGAIPEPNRALLVRAADILKAQPSIRLIVAVYSDDMGDASKARTHTQGDAEMIVRALTDLGVSREQLTPLGVGSDFAVSDNHTELGRFKNRRVEFLAYDTAVLQALSQLPATAGSMDLALDAHSGMDIEVASAVRLPDGLSGEAALPPPQPAYAVENGQIVMQEMGEESQPTPSYPPVNTAPAPASQIPADLLAPLGSDPNRGTASQLNN